MKGEDKIFLLQVIHTMRVGDPQLTIKFFTEERIDRLLRIKEEIGKEALDQELLKLREVVYACD